MGNVIWRLFSGLSTVIIARLLGPEKFGMFGIVQNTARTFAVYAGFRMGATSAKFIAQYREPAPEKAAKILQLTLSTSLVTCLVISTCLFLFAPYLALILLNRPELSSGLAIGAFLIFFLVYSGVQEGALAGFENFRTIGRVNAVRGIATLFIMIPSTIFWGITGAFVGSVLVAAIALPLLNMQLKREQVLSKFPSHISFRDSFKEASILWEFALPGLIIAIMSTTFPWIGRVILVRQEFGYVELGIFEAANQWRTIVLFVPALLTRVALPILSETFNKPSTSHFITTVSSTLQVTVLVTLPLVILVIGITKPLSLLFGMQFQGIEKILPLLMASVFLFAVNQAIRQIYEAMGQPWMNFWMYLIWGVTFLFTCVLLVPKMGALGFALAHLVCEVTLLIGQSLYADHYLLGGHLQKQLPLFFYSAFIIFCALCVQYFVEPLLGIVVTTILIALGLIPLINRLWKYRHGAKDCDS